MSTNNTGAGGVRNLRAMFENKASDLSTSPPSRGRSPNGSLGSSNSRPVSKVRANFVSVERSGEGISPQRRPRKASDITMDGTNESVISNGVTSGLGNILKGSPFELGDAGKSTPTVEDKVINGAVTTENEKPATSEIKSRTDESASMVEKMKQPNPGPPPMTKLHTTGTGHPLKPLPTRQVHPKLSSPIESKKSPVAPTSSGPVVRPRGGVSKIQEVVNSAKEADESRQAITETPPSAPMGSGLVAKPRGGGVKIQAVMESAREAEESRRLTAEKETKKSAPTAVRSGPVVRPRGGGVKILGVMDSAREARESRIATQKATDSEQSAASEEKTNGISNKPDGALKSPKATRIPAHPRSPTKPLNSTSTTTAPVTTSTAKKDSGRGDTTEKKPATRVATRVVNSNTASSLARKTSRVSLNTNEMPKTRVSTTKPADDSFLARMTRPTASSAQKVHDKIQPGSPPQQRRASITKKDLAKKPSRRSLVSSKRVADENKENEDSAVTPSVLETLEAKSGKLQTSHNETTKEDEQSQQAEISAST